MSVDQETLDRLRKTMVDILDDFVRICEENNLIYYLYAGTLLGAVRHRGFIPWDDDIDVAMPRKDYEKFLDLFQKNTETNYYVLSQRCPITTYWHYRSYAKLCKKGTVYAENNIKPKDYEGIFIDIFPYDNSVPLLLPIQTKLIDFSDKLYHVKTNAYTTQNKIKRFFRNIICGLLPLQFCRTFLNKTYSFFNIFTTQRIIFLSAPSGYNQRITHKYSTIFPLTTVCFEGKHYNSPGKWDIFLTKIYGNYMELPPVEQRIIHDVNFVLFDDKDNK